MALKTLMLRKKIDVAKAELERAKEVLEEIKKREAELAEAVEEAGEAEKNGEEGAEEAQAAVEEEIEKFEAEKKEAEEKVAELDKKIQDLEEELEAEEKEQEEEPAEEESKEKDNKERKVRIKMETRKFFNFSPQERDAIFANEEVRTYMADMRRAMMDKRTINNVGLTIPEVFLGILKDEVPNYSILYKHIRVKPVAGTSRQLISSSLAEGVWTECCANLNELSMGFFDEEWDCFKVGGFFAVCDANLEDSDVDLAREILNCISRALGYALDKAILYGRNTTANSKMPLGIVSRLVQTAEPSGYPATARPWVDLHTSNILSIPANTKGVDLIAALLLNFAKAKNNYSRGEKLWLMNEDTHAQLMAALLETTANGAIVSAINGTMPVVGGKIEIVPFIPNNVIIAGYFDLYTLVERAGKKFATSEHVRFLQDQTVFKGTARYDGSPSIAEAFVAIGLNGVTPTAAMTFAADTANI